MSSTDLLDTRAINWLIVPGNRNINKFKVNALNCYLKTNILNQCSIPRIAISKRKEANAIMWLYITFMYAGCIPLIEPKAHTKL
jgi:hypothetical protein